MDSKYTRGHGQEVFLQDKVTDPASKKILGAAHKGLQCP